AWRRGLVTFAIVPVLSAGAGYFRLRARDAYREVRRRLARLNAFLEASIQGMAVVQLFAREAHERREFQARNEDYRVALFASTRFEASLYAAVEALGAVALAMLLWYGGGRILAGALTFGALVAFIQYTNRFFLPIRDLGAKYTVMQAAMASAERIFSLLDREPVIATPARGITPPPVTAKGRVAFEGVWFAYADERWVLAECSFTVAPGEHVALVGTTGEGKSTCVRLLNSTWDVGRGRVVVDGVDVRSWDLGALRRHVGVNFQDPVLFTGSVESNLALDGVDGRAAIERAVVSANASALVARLPQGLATPLVERAANLSHGERQLLAIARAL